MKTKFPYEDAAEIRLERLWVCKSCQKAWAADKHSESDTFNAEIAARSCCTGQRPCSVDGCSSLSAVYRTQCPKHLAESDEARWRAKERQPLNGHMIYSLTLERFFHDEGDAWSEASDRVWESIDRETEEEHDPTPDEIRAELEKMHLVLCEPQSPPVFEIARHLEDWLPNDGETEADHWLDTPDLAAAEDLVNEALAKMPPLYMPTSKALDLSCFSGPDGPFVKSEEAARG